MQPDAVGSPMLDGWPLCGAERRLRHVERHDTRDCSVVVSVVVRPGATVESGSPLSGSCDYATPDDNSVPVHIRVKIDRSQRGSPLSLRCLRPVRFR